MAAPRSRADAVTRPRRAAQSRGLLYSTKLLRSARTSGARAGGYRAGSPRSTLFTPLANCHQYLTYCNDQASGHLGISRNVIIHRLSAIIIVLGPGLPRAPGRARILVTGPHAGGRPPVQRCRRVTVVRVAPPDDGVEDGQRSRRVRAGRPRPRSRRVRAGRPRQRACRVRAGGPRQRSRRVRAGRPRPRSCRVRAGRPRPRSCRVRVGRPRPRATAAGLIVSAAG